MDVSKSKVEPVKVQVEEPQSTIECQNQLVLNVKEPPFVETTSDSVKNNQQENTSTPNQLSEFLFAKMSAVLNSASKIPQRTGSWIDFFQPKQFSIPASGGDISERLRSNLHAFYGNYAIITLILLAYCLLSSPLLLIGVILCGYLGYFVVNRNQDITLFGQNINQSQQLIAIAVCSVPLFLLLGITGIFFWLIGASTCVVALHSIFHQVLKQEETQVNEIEATNEQNIVIPQQNGVATFQVIAL